jgi:hypothetical protein
MPAATMKMSRVINQMGASRLPLPLLSPIRSQIEMK